MELKDFAMETHGSTIDELFASRAKYFLVPVFQRNYTWTVNECQVLIEDIRRSLKTQEQHFLGDITVYDKNSTAICITDGQQRLTSIMLLALAVLAKIKNAAKKYKKQIEKFKVLAYNNDSFKVSLNRDDLTVLEQVVKDNPAGLDSLPEELRKERNIEKNYNFFLGFVEDYMDEKGSLDDLYDVIVGMKVTVMKCSIENAQIVYACKNSRGIPLKQVELIKNLFFSKIPENKHQEYFDMYWLEIERNVFPHNMEDFFMDAMIAISHMKNILVPGINWHIKERMLQNMVDFLKKMGNNRSPEKQVKTILEDLLRYAKLYREYVNFDKKYTMANGDELKNRFYEYEKLFGGKMFNGIMLYLLDAYKRHAIRKEPFIGAMRAFVTAQARAKFIGQFKGAQRQNASGLIEKIKGRIAGDGAEKLEDIVWEILLDIPGTNGIPRDKTAISYITENQLGLSGFAKIATKCWAGKYLLYRVNVVANDNAPMPAFDVNKCTVEHIIPPKDKNVWRDEFNTENEDKMSQIIGQFGNLALVTKASNSNYFADKAPVYKKSDYPVTRKIGKNKVYRNAEVEAQTRKYAELFCKAFPIPAKYLTNEN